MHWSYCSLALSHLYVSIGLDELMSIWGSLHLGSKLASEIRCFSLMWHCRNEVELFPGIPICHFAICRAEQTNIPIWQAAPSPCQWSHWHSSNTNPLTTSRYNIPLYYKQQYATTARANFCCHHVDWICDVDWICAANMRKVRKWMRK